MMSADSIVLTPQMFRAVERLLTLAAADGYETWFISYLEIERTATVLRTWERTDPPPMMPAVIGEAALRRGRAEPAGHRGCTGLQEPARPCTDLHR
jgi:hypothetical protein